MSLLVSSSSWRSCEKGDPLETQLCHLPHNGTWYVDRIPSMRRKNVRSITDRTSSLSVPRSFSKTARPGQGIGFEAVCIRYANGSRFRIAKDVALLRPHHLPGEDVLPGVRKVPRSSHAKIKI